MTKKDRFEKIIAYFSEHQPMAETELHYKNPFQLLTAVILSAQCTDKRVNMVTPALFKAFPTPEIMGAASSDEVLKYIKSISYPSSKSQYLVGMAKMLTDDFNGVIPSDTDDLQKLPGVGRKTANVIASVVFKKPVLAVDTHVFRVAARLGLTTDSTTPLETEKQLVKHIPKEKIAIFHHWIILHGRYICTARSPKCYDCPLQKFCKYFENLQRKVKK